MGENSSVSIPFLVKFYQFRRHCGPLESLFQVSCSRLGTLSNLQSDMKMIKMDFFYSHLQIKDTPVECLPCICIGKPCICSTLTDVGGGGIPWITEPW